MLTLQEPSAQIQQPIHKRPDGIEGENTSEIMHGSERREKPQKC